MTLVCLSDNYHRGQVKHRLIDINSSYIGLWGPIVMSGSNNLFVHFIIWYIWFQSSIIHVTNRLIIPAHAFSASLRQDMFCSMNIEILTSGPSTPDLALTYM
jgi:hypothetical protein